MKMTLTRPRIYVASLADYNAGRLHGRWIDADQDAEAIMAEVSDMLKASPEPFAEEWAIHDFEGFGGLALGEFESFETVAEVAGLIGEHGALFAEVVHQVGGLSELDAAKRAMTEQYLWTWDTFADYAESFVDDVYGQELTKLPPLIAGHIDYQAIARDLYLGGDVFVIEFENRVFVFHGNT